MTKCLVTRDYEGEFYQKHLLAQVFVEKLKHLPFHAKYFVESIYTTTTRQFGKHDHDFYGKSNIFSIKSLHF